MLDKASLKPFLHAELKSLNLSGCPLIDGDAILEIERQCPQLKRLYLNRCSKLRAFEKSESSFSTTYLNFSGTEMQLRHCKSLDSIYLDAPNLKKLRVEKNPLLRTLILKPLALYKKENFKECAKLDFNRAKSRRSK